MKLIVGLGNPGDKYQTTRHNVGFLAVDSFLEKNDLYNAKSSKNFEALVYEAELFNQKVVLLKPQTYMNDSGLAVKACVNFYKLDIAKDLLVIHDEVDLPFGAYKTAFDSSSAGHQGINSLIDNLGSQKFSRVRIGVEARQDKKIPPTDDFVLQSFTAAELEQLNSEVLPKIHFEIEKFIKQN